MAQATWQRSSTSLSRKAVQAMHDLPWFPALHPEQQSYVRLTPLLDPLQAWGV